MHFSLKKQSLPFVSTEINLEGIIRSEINLRKNTARFHFYGEILKWEYVEIKKNRKLFISTAKVGCMGRYWSRNTKIQLFRMNKSRDQIYNMITIINNIELCTGNSKTAHFKCFQYIHKATIK